MSLPPSTLLPQLVTDLTAFRQALSVMLEHTAGTTPSRTAQVVSGSKASYWHFWVFSSMACVGVCVLMPPSFDPHVRAHSSLPQAGLREACLPHSVCMLRMLIHERAHACVACVSLAWSCLPAFLAHAGWPSGMDGPPLVLPPSWMAMRPTFPAVSNGNGPSMMLPPSPIAAYLDGAPLVLPPLWMTVQPPLWMVLLSSCHQYP